MRPAGFAHYCPYSLVSDYHIDWHPRAWTDDTTTDMTLGVIDFRRVPGIQMKEDSTVTEPYFSDFMTSLRRRHDPSFEDIPVWLFMCGDKNELTQVVHFIQNDLVLDKYGLEYANYVPTPLERLGHYSASNSKAKAKVYLIFLQDKNNQYEVDIPEYFNAPSSPIFTKPRKCNELEYRIYSSELQMEFYLWLTKVFCMPGNNVFSVFTGRKLCNSIFAEMDSTK